MLRLLLMTALPVAANAQTVRTDYPDGSVVEIEIYNYQGSSSNTRVISTPLGDLVLQYTMTPNIKIGFDSNCCADNVEVLSKPDNTLCQPACSLTLEEDELGTINIIEWYGN